MTKKARKSKKPPKRSTKAGKVEVKLNKLVLTTGYKKKKQSVIGESQHTKVEAGRTYLVRELRNAGGQSKHTRRFGPETGIP